MDKLMNLVGSFILLILMGCLAYSLYTGLVSGGLLPGTGTPVEAIKTMGFIIAVITTVTLALYSLKFPATYVILFCGGMSWGVYALGCHYYFAPQESQWSANSHIAYTCLESDEFFTGKVHTYLQKNEKWEEDFKNERVEWDLIVAEIKDDYTVIYKCVGSDSLYVDIAVEYDSSYRNFLLGLNKGSIVRDVSIRLDSYSTSWGLRGTIDPDN